MIGLVHGFDVQADGPTFGLRRVAPARRRQLRRLAHDHGQVHRLAVVLGCGASEQQQPLDRLAAVQGCLGGGGQQVLELRQIRRILDQRLASQVAVAGHEHQRLVEVVGDAARHLAQRAQLLGLRHRLALLLGLLGSVTSSVCSITVCGGTNT